MKMGGVLKTNKVKLGNSIFSRLLITFLIIMIPIYMLSIYMYRWGSHTVKNEISKSAITQASFYLEELEKEIERIKILQYDCLNDEYLNKLAIRWEVMDIYDTMESIRQLQLRLITIKNSSTYIKNVSAHILPIRKTISSNRGMDAIDMDKYKGIRVPFGINGAQIISYEDGLFLSTVQQSDITNYNPLYLIEIELDKDVLRHALSKFNIYENGGSYLINLTDNCIISNQLDTYDTLFTDDIIAYISQEDCTGIKYNEIENDKYWIVYAKSDYLNMALIKYIPEGIILKPLKNFNIWLWIFSVAAICFIIIYSFSTYKFVHMPLMELVKSFRKVEGGDLQVTIEHDSNDEFGYLYKSFNDMTRNLNRLIDEVYNQKLLMQRAELKQLQSQINPHFLYNSFFMINTMARVGDENLIQFTKYLGEYFRFVTRNSSDYVSLLEEVNHARVYANIQLMRFSKRVEIQFAECPEEYKNLQVPRLILQPIIENAFEHSIENKSSGGIILINFESDEEELSIIVEDNGDYITDADLSKLQGTLQSNERGAEITGLININRRIKLVFGEGSGLQVLRSELGGLKVILKIIIPRGDNNV